MWRSLAAGDAQCARERATAAGPLRSTGYWGYMLEVNAQKEHICALLGGHHALIRKATYEMRIAIASAWGAGAGGLL